MTFEEGDGDAKDSFSPVFEEYSTKRHFLKKLASKTPPKEEKKTGLFTFRTKVRWRNVAFFVFMHVLAVVGFFRIFRSSLLTFLFAYFLEVATGAGITIGAHRLYAHRSYRANSCIRFILVALHTVSGENSMYTWVRDHRQHHRYSDTDADPHNANRGLFFSHMGWLMMDKLPEVKTVGRKINLRDLERDPFVMFQKRWFFQLYFLLGLVIPVAIPVLLWSEDLSNSFFICYALRTVFVWHITWFVNSIAHWEGPRPYDKQLKPVESPFVSKMTYGEGWHNFHHRFPFDYTAGIPDRSYNWSTHVIRWAASHGWIWDLRRATPHAVLKAMTLSGDGSVAPEDVIR